MKTRDGEWCRRKKLLFHYLHGWVVMCNCVFAVIKQPYLTDSALKKALKKLDCLPDNLTTVTRLEAKECIP